MTKAVSNREICFIKAVLLLCEHGYFFSKLFENGVKSPPSPILLGLSIEPDLVAGWRSGEQFHHGHPKFKLNFFLF